MAYADLDVKPLELSGRGSPETDIEVKQATVDTFHVCGCNEHTEPGSGDKNGVLVKCIQLCLDPRNVWIWRDDRDYGTHLNVCKRGEDGAVDVVSKKLAGNG